MFFVGQDLKHVHMTYLFLNFIIFWLTLVNIYRLEFIPHYIKGILRIKYKLQRKRIIKQIQIGLHFHLPLILNLKNPGFFYVELKILINNFFNFSKLHEHIFRYSRSQMFFKIGVLKNFVIIWIKKRLNTGFYCEY